MEASLNGNRECSKPFAEVAVESDRGLVVCVTVATLARLVGLDSLIS